jgi:hypothetical protein
LKLNLNINNKGRLTLKPCEISAVVASATIMIGLIWYIRLVIQGKIQTVVSSWLVSTVALTLSLVTYITSPNANLLGGSLNASSAIAVAGTLVAVYIQSRIKGQQISINPFQKKCLLASACITVIWIVIVILGGTGVIPNILTQMLLVISYSMLIVKFWRAEKNTESLVTWWCVFVSSIVAIYTAWIKDDHLAMLYAIRSTVMCGILIFALHRIEFRAKFFGLGSS